MSYNKCSQQFMNLCKQNSINKTKTKVFDCVTNSRMVHVYAISDSVFASGLAVLLVRVSVNQVYFL